MLLDQGTFPGDISRGRWALDQQNNEELTRQTRLTPPAGDGRSDTTTEAPYTPPAQIESVLFLLYVANM